VNLVSLKNQTSGCQ